MGFGVIGADVKTSVLRRYQQQFQLDLRNLALVLTFNF